MTQVKPDKPLPLGYEAYGTTLAVSDLTDGLWISSEIERTLQEIVDLTSRSIASRGSSDFCHPPFDPGLCR